MLKFFWNGIKDSGGKLQRCHYSKGALKHHPDGTFTIYAKDYGPFSEEIRQNFTVENDTEIITDYIMKDHIRVMPDHPLYPDVYAAWKKRESRYASRINQSNKK